MTALPATTPAGICAKAEAARAAQLRWSNAIPSISTAMDRAETRRETMAEASKMTAFDLTTRAVEDCEAALTRLQPAHWTDPATIEALADVRRALPRRRAIGGRPQMDCRLERAHAALVAAALLEWAASLGTDAPYIVMIATRHAREIAEQPHMESATKRLRAVAAALSA